VAADLGGNPKPVFDFHFRFQTNEIAPLNLCIAGENIKFMRGKRQKYLQKSNPTLIGLIDLL
jgi:hypothetical protein